MEAVARLYGSNETLIREIQALYTLGTTIVKRISDDNRMARESEHAATLAVMQAEVWAGASKAEEIVAEDFGKLVVAIQATLDEIDRLNAKQGTFFQVAATIDDTLPVVG
jgi:hypothetical protein